MFFFSPSRSFGVFIALAGIAAVVSSSTPAPLLSRRVLHEGHSSVPEGWTLRRRADPDAVLTLKISLRQSNLEHLDAFLLDVADPESPNYGQHWTPARVAETFRPSEASLDAVRAWLAADGFEWDARARLSASGAHVHLNASVAEAERLFAAQYFEYEHAESGEGRVGCHAGYHLPEHVAAHVELVTPTVQFGSVKVSMPYAKRELAGSTMSGAGRRPVRGGKGGAAVQAVSSGTANCDLTTTLDCIRSLYNFNYDLVVPDQNSVAVVEFSDLKQTFNPKDMDVFFQNFSPAQVGQRPTLVSFDGGKTNFSDTTVGDLEESNMDFQLVMGLLGKTQEVKLYQVGMGEEAGLPYDLIFAGLDSSYCNFNGSNQYKNLDCGNKPPAYVVSISYGGNDDVSIQRQSCTEFGKLSLMGMTFFVSSGDTGVASGGLGKCPGNKFIASWPATCPYVTAVGATQIDPGKTTRDPESATTEFASGGGFSDVFARPRWQNRAVKKYLSNSVPSYAKGLFNATGRAIPDVAANGWNTTVVVDSQILNLGGTSASAPIFASMITAVNDARLAAGKGPVGFINPVLYSHLFAGVFNDITVGSNPGCGTDGFPTAPGWDPVTGLGTPDFQKMLTRFMLLP